MILAAVRGLIEPQVAQVRGQPLVVGVNGPQGAGKSTLCAALVAAFRADGVRAFAISVDDFYLTRAEQVALAARHPGNRFLEHRGAPGTHDVALGDATLRALRGLGRADAGPVTVPVYDKSAHGGRGDRAPVGCFPFDTPPGGPPAGRAVAPLARSSVVEGRLDVLLVEGWMLGFRTGVDPANPPDPLDLDRKPVDAALRPYGRWMAHVDTFVHLDAPTERLSQVVDWRVDAERARRAAGATALTDAEARDYIERFLPLYRAYAPTLAAGADVPGPSLYGVLGADRGLAAPLEHRPVRGPRVPNAPGLTFRPWAGAADLPLARTLWGEAEVMRFLDAHGPWDDAKIAARLDFEAGVLADAGVQYWPFFDAGSGELLGVCGLRPYTGPGTAPGEAVYELGFHLRPQVWGRGLATTAAKAAIRMAFDRLGATWLFAGHHPENLGSRRVLEKLGFRQYDAALFPPTGRVHPSLRLEP